MKRPRTKKQEESLSSNVIFLEELLGILTAMLVLRGNILDVPSHEHDLRMALVESLRKLADAMEKVETIHPRSLHEERDTFEHLLEVENAASQVWSKSELFLRRVEEEKTEVQNLYQELDMIPLSRPREIRLNVFIRSFSAAFGKQLNVEESMVKQIVSYLSRLHGSNHFSSSGEESSEGEKSNKLKEWALLLEQTYPAGSPVWMEAMALVNHVPGRNKEGRVGVSFNQTDQRRVEIAREKVSLVDKRQMLLGAPTVQAAARMFLTCETECSLQPNNVMFVLLRGAEGFGKTHTMSEIQRLEADGSKVLRPSLPLDIVGETVGETEDHIISIFGMLLPETISRGILLLDDFDHLLGLESTASEDATRQSSGEPHFVARVRSAMLSIVDTIQSGLQSHQELLVICTSREDVNQKLNRFEKVFHLTPPDSSERRSFFISSLNLDLDEFSSEKRQEIDRIMSSLVECSVGRSYAELSQFCRRTIEADRGLSVSHGLLPAGESEHMDQHGISLTKVQTLRGIIQSQEPASLRSGSVADFVDMRVLNEKDLPGYSPGGLPLFGSIAETAWKKLEALIVIPLCKSGALAALLDGGSKARTRTVCGGVLLSGPPGCGKTSIAYHCLAAAAAHLPSIRLLDVSCTSLIHKEVGGSEQAVHRVFACARSAAPCILLMDGIENIAAVRGNDNTTEGTMDRVLSTLLTEMDGVDPQNDDTGRAGPIAVIGVTHNASWIDPALKRPGRLERIVELSPPDETARLRIAEKELQASSAMLASLGGVSDFVAQQTSGMSASDVIAVVNDFKLMCLQDLNVDTRVDVDGVNASDMKCLMRAIENRRIGTTNES